MTALSFVWVHPYSQISGCDNTVIFMPVHTQNFLEIL